MEATLVSLLMENWKDKGRLVSTDKIISMIICHSLGLLCVGEVVYVPRALQPLWTLAAFQFLNSIRSR
jgi:hypothetical protein